MNKLICTAISFSLAIVLIASCKKSGNHSSTPTGPASTTTWTTEGHTYTQREGAVWVYDTASTAGILYTEDSTGISEVEVAFFLSSPSARPTPGTYYFANANGTNLPPGVSPNQLILMQIGDPNSGTSLSSTGGSTKDSAVVTTSGTGKLTVWFSNISITDGTKVSGTLIEQ